MNSQIATQPIHDVDQSDSHDERFRQYAPTDAVIPATRGEYYSYSSEFTKARPVYTLMHCKASKSRAVADLEDLGREAILHFRFDGTQRARVHSLKNAHALGLLGNTAFEANFAETRIAPVEIPTASFYELGFRKDMSALVDICDRACSSPVDAIILRPGAFAAVMTAEGRYGLFLVKTIDRSSIQVDACHLLL